jgi:hypothetical protein
MTRRADGNGFGIVLMTLTVVVQLDANSWPNDQFFLA